MLDKQTFAIGILGLTAAVLVVANALTPSRVEAGFTIKDRDYTVATGRSARGGETLMILDNRTSNFGFFAYDAARKDIRLIARENITKAFPPQR